MSDDYDAAADYRELWRSYRQEEAGAYWGIVGALGWIAARSNDFVTAAAHDLKAGALTALCIVLGKDSVDAAAAALIVELARSALAATIALETGERVYVDPVHFADARLEYYGSVRLIRNMSGMRFAAADVQKLWPALSIASVALAPLPPAKLRAWIKTGVASYQTQAKCFDDAKVAFPNHRVSREQVRRTWIEEMERAGRPVMPGKKTGAYANCAGN